jgi:hypothetical protein
MLSRWASQASICPPDYSSIDRIRNGVLSTIPNACAHNILGIDIDCASGIFALLSRCNGKRCGQYCCGRGLDL